MKKEGQNVVDLSPEQVAIGELLLKEGFNKYDNVFKPFQSNMGKNEDWRVREIDVEKFSHMKRIHEVHYLAYSQDMKHFSIVVKFDRPKGESGGGMRKWRSMMIPRVISNAVIAREFLTGMFGSNGIFLEKAFKEAGDRYVEEGVAYDLWAIEAFVAGAQIAERLKNDGKSCLVDIGKMIEGCGL